MSSTANKFKSGDHVYLFEHDPECDTIYEIQRVNDDGEYELYHPMIGTYFADGNEIKHSIH